MNILLTGGNGFIGSVLKTSLINFKLYKNDKTLPTVSDLAEQMNNVDIVVHLAGGGGNKFCNSNPKMAIFNNILLTKQLVEAAKIAKVKQFIFASTIAVYSTYANVDNPILENREPNPDDIYGSIKWCCEEIVKEIPFTILRFANVYGYGSGINLQKGGVINNIYLNVRNTNVINLTDPNLAVDFVHVSDVVEAILRSINNDKAINQIINIGSGRPITLMEIANTITKFSDYPIEIKIDNKPMYSSRWLDINKARVYLQWEPKVVLDDGIKELLFKLK